MAQDQPADGESGSVSSTLLEQLRGRRPEAWERFVRLYGGLIHRWCRRAGLTAEDAADVLQEVLAAVMLHLPDFCRDQPGASFGGWLATITRNKVRDHYRRRHGRAEARGGSTAQRLLSEIPQPPELSEESIRADADSAVMALAAGAGNDPRGIRDPHVAGILANHGRRAAAGLRGRRPPDERGGRLHGQIAGSPPVPPGDGGIAAQ